MTKYTRGANYERLMKKRLEALGYYVVRSAGSHGVADLVAIGAPNTYCVPVLLVQCKYGKTGPNNEDFDKLEDVANRYFVDAAMAWKKGKDELTLFLQGGLWKNMDI